MVFWSSNRPPDDRGYCSKVVSLVVISANCAVMSSQSLATSNSLMGRKEKTIKQKLPTTIRKMIKKKNFCLKFKTVLEAEA